MKIWLFIIVVIIVISIFSLFILFLTPEGVVFVHKNTNIICNQLYDESLNGFKLQANTTLNYEFINECEERGIGTTGVRNR